MSDLIRREDAIQALVDCDAIKGYGYSMLERALSEIPSVEVAYLCNRKKCEYCWSECFFTKDREFAADDTKAVVITDLGEPKTDCPWK